MAAEPSQSQARLSRRVFRSDIPPTTTTRFAFQLSLRHLTRFLFRVFLLQPTSRGKAAVLSPKRLTQFWTVRNKLNAAVALCALVPQVRKSKQWLPTTVIYYGCLLLLSALVLFSLIGSCGFFEKDLLQGKEVLKQNKGGHSSSSARLETEPATVQTSRSVAPRSRKQRYQQRGKQFKLIIVNGTSNHGFLSTAQWRLPDDDMKEYVMRTDRHKSTLATCVATFSSRFNSNVFSPVDFRPRFSKFAFSWFTLILRRLYSVASTKPDQKNPPPRKL